MTMMAMMMTDAERECAPVRTSGRSKSLADFKEKKAKPQNRDRCMFKEIIWTMAFASPDTLHNITGPCKRMPGPECEHKPAQDACGEARKRRPQLRGPRAHDLINETLSNLSPNARHTACLTCSIGFIEENLRNDLQNISILRSGCHLDSRKPNDDHLSIKDRLILFVIAHPESRITPMRRLSSLCLLVQYPALGMVRGGSSVAHVVVVKSAHPLQWYAELSQTHSNSRLDVQTNLLLRRD